MASLPLHDIILASYPTHTPFPSTVIRTYLHKRQQQCSSRARIQDAQPNRETTTTMPFPQPCLPVPLAPHTTLSTARLLRPRPNTKGRTPLPLTPVTPPIPTHACEMRRRRSGPTPTDVARTPPGNPSRNAAQRRYLRKRRQNPPAAGPGFCLGPWGARRPSASHGRNRLAALGRGRCDADGVGGRTQRRARRTGKGGASPYPRAAGVVV